MQTGIKRMVVAALVISMALPLLAQRADASVPYDSYTYNYWLEPVKSPAPYVPDKEYSGMTAGAGPFSNPNDLYMTDKGQLYIADTGNNRIVRLDADMRYVDEIGGGDGEEALRGPQGVFVTKDGRVYVADTGNGRIVEFDENHGFVRAVGRPETELITDATAFRPTKVAVDGAGRIYALAIGINSGIVELNPDGSFQGFMGASEVAVNPAAYLWRRYLASEEQRNRMRLNIPTEYNNLYLDSREFMYVTMGNVEASDYGIDVIRRLNPSGVNVIRNLGYGPPIGDYFVRDDKKITRFNDVSVTGYQVYTALDGANGKLFAYDYDGNLLYVFGSNGTREGMFRNAVALEQYEDRLYVLDAGKNAIVSFRMTNYGRAVNEAIALHAAGKYEESAAKWEETLRYNANSDMAYTGLGKVYLRNGEYKKAMDYFKLSHNDNYYSKAFTNYRRQFMDENLGLIFTIGLAGILAFVSFRLVTKLRGKKRMSGKEAGYGHVLE